MDIATVIQLVKDRIGIRTATSRDTLFSAIVNGAIRELQDVHGIALNMNDPNHCIFLVDFSVFRYENPKEGIPRNLQFRMHNLIIHAINTLYISNIVYVDILPTTPVINTVYILPDKSYSMYINGTWTAVQLVNGSWMAVV
jgi:hypothetical protein